MNKVNRNQVHEALQLQKSKRGPIGQILIDLGYITDQDLQFALARDHYPVRVYIPYGTEWYPYLTRRLAERPANMWFFAQQLLRGGKW